MSFLRLPLAATCMNVPRTIKKVCDGLIVCRMYVHIVDVRLEILWLFASMLECMSACHHVILYSEYTHTSHVIVIVVSNAVRSQSNLSQWPISYHLTLSTRTACNRKQCVRLDRNLKQYLHRTAHDAQSPIILPDGHGLAHRLPRILSPRPSVTMLTIK